MKKVITLLIILLFTGGLMAQNEFKYEIRAYGGLSIGGSDVSPNVKITSLVKTVGNKLLFYDGATPRYPDGVTLYADTATMLSKYARLASPTFSGVPKIGTDTIATKDYARSVGGSGSMIYPDAGIALSTGSAWGSSITDNSANWNTAYGWGDHASGGYTSNSDTASMLSPYIHKADTATMLSGYINKVDTASMMSPYARLASPIFTGVPKLTATDTIATQAYARTYGGSGTVTIGDVRDEIADSLNILRPLVVMVADTADMLTPYINKADTADMLATYALTSEVRGIVHDSLDYYIENAEVGISIGDSTGITQGNYMPRYQTASLVSDSLDNYVAIADTSDMLADYINKADTSDMLAPYAPKNNPVFTGVQKVSTTDTLATQAYARTYGGTGTVTIGDVRDEIADSLDALRPQVRFLADTIPLFIFGLGSGASSDTIVFKDNAIAGSFYNSGSDTLRITSIKGVLAEGTGTETVAVQVSWHATFKSGSATNLNSSAYTVTSITTGDEDTSFANSKIPPGIWVWCTISATSTGNKPSMLILTMSGYKIPKY